jgi:iron complex outermembrane receptor protein
MPSPTRPQSAAPARRRKPLSQAAHIMLLGFVVAASASQAASPAPLETLETRDYQLPAGPLGLNLATFAVRSGVALSFDPALTTGLNSPAVAGNFKPADALQRLLAGSKLQVLATEDGHYTLTTIPVAAPATGDGTLPTVTVNATSETQGSQADAYRARQARVGALGDKALKDTPYSIEVYSRELLDNKQARSLSDATRGDASVSLSAGNLITENNAVAIRGISPDFSTGRKIDGLNVRTRADDLPLEHFESVDILKGAGAFLYGFGAPGGVINYTVKRPTDEPLRRLSTQFMGSGLWLLHGDAGGRIGPDKAFGYRVNAVNEEGDTYINDGTSKRSSGSVALDWRITPDIVWRVDMLSARHVRKGGYWSLVPNDSGTVSNTTGSPLAPIDGSKRLAPSFTRYASKHETWGTDASWKIAPEWKLELAHRFSKNGREFMSPAIYANADGKYTMRFYNYANRFESTHSQAMVLGKARTGPIGHDLAFGLSRTQTRSFNTNVQSAFSSTGNLSDPLEFSSPFSAPVNANNARIEYARNVLREVFASDTLHIGQDIDLIVGARRANLHDLYGSYDRTATTPSLAVVYRPVAGLSTYASYVEALEEGSTAPSTAANAGEIFAPMVSKQYELGLKAEHDNWSASAALFQLKRGLSFTDSNNVFSQDGEARYQGLELGSKLRIDRQWVVTASAMWLDATSQKTTDASLEGKHIQGVARKQFATYAEYKLPSLPLTFSAGARYIGKRPVDTANLWKLDPVTLFDAGARYVTELGGFPVTVRLNIENIADKAYWVSAAASNAIIQGAPRTLKLGTQIDF